MAQEAHTATEQLAFGGFQLQVSFSESLENGFKTEELFIKSSSIGNDIIDVDEECLPLQAL